MNMKKTSIYTASLLAVLSSSSALAQSGPLYGCTADFAQPTEQKATIVYFGNGVGNTLKDAYLSTAYLEELYKPMLEGLGSDPGTFIFLTAYNPTEGTLEDLKEVADQRARLGDIGTYVSFFQLSSLVRANLERTQILARVVAGLGGPVSKIIGDRLIDSIITPDLLDFVAKQQEEFYDRTLRANLRAIAENNQLSAVERRHVRLYTRDLRLGRRVFVVAHSQGNLFANIVLPETAKNRPNEASSLAMVGVATPAAPGTQFRGHQTEAYYRTAHDDAVINGLRLLGPVLDSNIDNDLSVLDSNTKPVEKAVATFLGVPIVAEVVDAVAVRDTRSDSNHSFIQDYMADGLPSRKDIDSEMKRLAAAVPFPTPTPEPKSNTISDAIQASLTDVTYGGAFAVDLTVSNSVPPGAPSGNISMILPSGRFGIGVGPNYFLGCLDVRPGTYEIGVATYDPIEFNSDRPKCVERALYNQYRGLYYIDPGPAWDFCDTLDLMTPRTLTANLKLTLGDGTKLSKPVKLNVSYRVGASYSAETIESMVLRGDKFPGSVINVIHPDRKTLFTVQVTENVDPTTQERLAAYSVK